RTRRVFSRRRRVGKYTRSATNPPPPPRHSSAVRTFSSTVSQPNVCTRWNVRLRPRRALPLDDFWVRSTPSSTTRPPTGLRIPETTSKSVVLPAPFGPMMPTTSPASARMLTSSRATIPPKRTVTPAMSKIGPAAGAARSPRLASTLIPNDLPPSNRSWCGCTRVCQSLSACTNAPASRPRSGTRRRQLRHRVAEDGAARVLREPRKLVVGQRRPNLPAGRADPVGDRLEHVEIEAVDLRGSRGQELVERVVGEVVQHQEDRLDGVGARPLGMRDVGTPHEV